MPRPAALPALACVLLAASLFPGPARADAPLRTDNAYVGDPGNAKLEALYAGTRSEGSFGAAVTTVVVDWLELGAGYARSRGGEEGPGHSLGLQAKVPLVKESDARPLALAATFSVARDTGEPSGRTGFQAGWLNVPASYAFDVALTAHLNAGVLWQTGAKALATWGAAAEYAIGRVTLLGEGYRIEPGAARYDAGARCLVVDGFTVYASVGRRFGADPGDWQWTAGIKLETDHFLH